MVKQRNQDFSAILDEKLRSFKEEFKGELGEELKVDMIRVFNQGFDEVIEPMLETLATKEDVKRMENRLGGMENRLGGIENRLEQMDRKLDVVTGKVFEHDSEIRKIKQRTAAP